MDVVKISNEFNVLTQLSPFFNFYHAGILSQINQPGIDNNFDPTNAKGKEYPLVWFNYATSGTTTFNQQFPPREALPSTMEVELIFYDTMFYDGTASATTGSTNDTRTEVEIFRDLHRGANDLLSALPKAAFAEKATDTKAKCNFFYIEGPVQWEYFPFKHNNRLACIRAQFTLSFRFDCPTFDPDFSTLVAPNAIPVPSFDLEDPNHPSDSV